MQFSRLDPNSNRATALPPLPPLFGPPSMPLVLSPIYVCNQVGIHTYA